MKINYPKIVFISWAPYCSRSDHIARELNGKSFLIYLTKLNRNHFTIAIKYFLQSLITLSILIMEKPDAVIVMNPSVMATFPVYIYSKMFGIIYIIDAHSGVLSDHSLYLKIRNLQKLFSKNALFTIVTNKEIAKILEFWGAKYIIVPDVPVTYDTENFKKQNSKVNITLVNSFAKDEPLLNFLEATKKFEKINFFITGKITRENKSFLKNKPPNVKFTNFLNNQSYYSLIKSSDVIAVLTTRENTMQRGAYEAIYNNRPVITSDWKILKENFPIGAVFVDNTTDGIARGIKDAVLRIDELTAEAKILKEKKIKRWEENKEKIIGEISANLAL